MRLALHSHLLRSNWLSQRLLLGLRLPPPTSHSLPQTAPLLHCPPQLTPTLCFLLLWRVCRLTRCCTLAPTAPWSSCPASRCAALRCGSAVGALLLAGGVYVQRRWDCLPPACPPARQASTWGEPSPVLVSQHNPPLPSPPHPLNPPLPSPSHYPRAPPAGGHERRVLPRLPDRHHPQHLLLRRQQPLGCAQLLRLIARGSGAGFAASRLSEAPPVHDALCPPNCCSSFQQPTSPALTPASLTLAPHSPAFLTLAYPAAEATIAKRRSYANTISYLTPPAENAGLYKARLAGWLVVMAPELRL